MKNEVLKIFVKFESIIVIKETSEVISKKYKNCISIIDNDIAEIIMNESINNLLEQVSWENCKPIIWISKKLLSITEAVGNSCKISINGKEKKKLLKKLQERSMVFVLNKNKNAWGVIPDDEMLDELILLK